jgi:aryl-alcohol dehydrogenase-like predicted oxidoreductase
MRYVDLGASGLKASALGFGCAAVMGRVGRTQSLRVLGEAFDAGISFFDTARSYGYGESEALLGEFLDGRRNQVILSTKFGIVPVRQQAWKQALKPVVRSVIGMFPSARNLVQKQVKAQFQEGQYSKDVLHRSLEESLRKLHTDYVDILFIHVGPLSVLAQCDLLEELDGLVRSGMIRVAGISAEPDVIAATLRTNTPLTAMQFPVNLFDLSLVADIKAAQHRGFIFIANHPFGGADGVSKSRIRLRELAASRGISAELHDKLMSKDPGTLSEIVLNLVLADTGIQVVVPSMMKVNHLRANVQAISNCRFTGEELAWIRRKLVQVPMDGVETENSTRAVASL